MPRARQAMSANHYLLAMDQSPRSTRLPRLILSALVFVLGLQSMRFLFGSLTWYLRDTLGVAVLDLVPIALAPFLLASLLPISSRWLGVRTSLWTGLSLLVVSRIVLQGSSAPSVDFWAASIGTLAFVGLLALLFTFGRVALVGGLLLGLALDSAIKGLSLSLDLAYQPGWAATFAVGALGFGVVWAMTQAGQVSGGGVGWGNGAMLLSIGPFLFAQALILQSQGWTSEVAGISGATAQMRISLLNIAALYLAAKWSGRRWLLLIAVAVVSATVLLAEGSGSVFNILSLAAVPLAGVVWANMVPRIRGVKTLQSGFYLVTGMTLFLILGLAYYLPLDMNLGFAQQDVRVGVALLLLLFGLAAFVRTGPAYESGGADWVFAAAAALLPVVAFIGVAVSSTESEVGQTGEPIRFMTYNVHSAFNTDGVMDVDAIAEVVASSGAQVVAFQEMPRGRLISATTDLMTLLKVRLGFEHVAYFGTTDAVWGNAVFSRFPIVDVVTEDLPRVGTPMQRGYLGAKITHGDQEILVISTHLQHVNDSDVHDQDPEADLLPVHTSQIETILNSWGGTTPAVLMGDFNARPEWEQIGLVESVGFLDVWAEVGSGDGFTSGAADPMYRIDYIFSQDMVAWNAQVISSTASDHLPVVADLSIGPTP